jgi:hypothetical protein
MASPRTGVLITLAVVGVVAAAAGEAALRWGAGLGDPPLVRLDPDTEYELIPSRTYNRFGNLIAVNAHGMRGPEHPAEAAPDERRVLLVGDSVVYGNHFLDQTETVAAVLTERLASEPQFEGCRPLAMAAAASSWGPVNQAAFLERIGTLGAGAAAIVVSAHDLYDTPGGGTDLIPYRLSQPVGAIGDAAVSVAERIARRIWPPVPPEGVSPPDVRRERSLAALGEMADLLATAGVPPLLVYHPTLTERQGAPAPERDVFAGWAEERGLAFADLGQLVPGTEGYRDDIHPDAAGAARIADTLADLLGPRLATCG